MVYSAQQQRDFTIDYLSQYDRLTDCFTSIVKTNFGNKTATQFAHHSLGRRISLVQRALNRIFEFIPLDVNGIPERNSLNDASIALQSLISNSYGVLDNIAWVWLHAHPDDSGLQTMRRNRVGLTQSHLQFRQTLPCTFVEELVRFDDWINHVKETRDALAHQKPIYIPPYTVKSEDAELYNELENTKFQSLAVGDFQTLEQAEKEQRSLCTFRPYWVKESRNKIQTFYIHPQAICDVMTICELVEKFLICFENQCLS